MITVDLPDGSSIDVDTDDEQQAAMAARKYLQKQNQISEPGQSQPAQDQTAQDQPTAMDWLKGGIQAAGAIGSSLITEPIAGYAGLTAAMGQNVNVPGYTPPDPEEVMNKVRSLGYSPDSPEARQILQKISGGAQAVADFFGNPLQKSRTGLGDYVFEKTGSPALGAIGYATPDAALMGAGAAAPTLIGKTAGSIGRRIEARGDALKAEAQAMQDAYQAPVKSPEISSDALQRVADTISSGKPEDLAELLRTNPEFIRAVDELGISTEPLAAYSSMNPQYRGIEQGLSAIPGSALDAQAKAFISEVSKKADELIQTYGGTLDKAALSNRFKQDSLKVVDSIRDQETEIYTALNKVLPPETRLKADNTVSFIENLEKGQALPPLLKKLKQELKPKEKTIKTGLLDEKGAAITRKEVTYPRYGDLVATTREVGAALGKRRAREIFTTTDEGLLKAVYANLKSDAGAFLEEKGFLQQKRAIDDLTVQRKQLEDSMKELLGRDLTGSLMTNVGAKAKNIIQQPEAFQETLNAIPQQYRQEAAVSAMNNIFRGSGADKQGLDVTQFSKFMDELYRQPAAKNLLYQNLPKGMGRDIDNLYEIAKGISLAQQDKIKTGLVSSLFDQNVGLVSKLAGKAGSALINLASAKSGIPPGMGSTIVEHLSGGKANKSKVIGEMLASPEFKKIVIDSYSPEVTKNSQAAKKLAMAEKAFEKSALYKKWADTLPNSQKARLSMLGLVSYLSAEPYSMQDQQSQGLTIPITRGQ